VRGWLMMLVCVGCGPSSYSEFRDQLAGRACGREVRCGAVGASEPERCGVPEVLALTRRGDVDVPAAVAAGRMSYSSDAAQRCLDAARDAPCDPQAAMLRWRHDCHAVTDAHVAVGHACDSDPECVGGACASAVAGCPGSCAAFASPGAPCAPDGGALTPDQLCDPTVQYCGAAQAGAPATCQRHKQSGAACATDEECAFDLVCRTTCQPPPRPRTGQPCDAEHVCADGNRCDASGTCVRLLGGGAACTDPSACQDGLACAGLTIDGAAPGVCQAWRDRGLGCMPGALVSGCPASQRCDAATSLCVAVTGGGPVGPRQSCHDRPCADGLFCAGDFTCHYRLGRTATCGPDQADACEAPLVCDPGTHLCSDGLCPS
jgi:hypothetical protein